MTGPKRDRWGRYILPDPITGEQKPWTRATTLADTLSDAYGLTNWKMRMVAYGIGIRPDLLDLACASDIDEDKQLDELAENALKAAKADEKSNTGTALHKFTQRVDMGYTSRAPKKYAEDLAEYDRIKKDEGILTHPRMCERITAVPELSSAGTMDKLVKWHDRPVIADLKTGGDNQIKYGGMSIAIQIAIYAHGGGLWNPDTYTWSKMPKDLDLKTGLVIHLPSGEAHATLYCVDLVRGWELAKVAYEVRNARKYKNYLTNPHEENQPIDNDPDTQ